MALGRKNQGNANTKLLVLKITTRDANKKNIPPVFTIFEKGTDGKYAPRKETETHVEGDLVKIEIKENEWEGEKYNTVSLYLADGDELYLVDTRVNMLTRSLYNSILSLKTFEKVSISLYVFKKTVAGVVKEYPAVSVWQSKEQVKWLVPIVDQPQPTSVTFKGKTINDYSAVDNFFIDKLRDFSKVVETAAKTRKPSEPKPAAKEAIPVAAGDDIPDDNNPLDPPF